MGATYTLPTTTLVYSVDATAGEVVLASVADVVPGLRLWIDRELFNVKRVLGTRQQGIAVEVFRGVDGTQPSLHSSSSLVTIGRPDQFYANNPVGAPPVVIPVSPYINALNGRVFVAQGDAADPAYRWWQEITTTYGIGPLGVRTQVSAPTVST